MTPPSRLSLLIRRAVLILLAGAALFLIVAVFAFLEWFQWRLKIYALILLAPALYALIRRGPVAWRDGLRALVSKSAWKTYGVAALGFISLAVLLYSYEGWRGRRLYAALQREVAAGGGSLDLSAVTPKPVPDDQNFCATPLLKALVDYDPMVQPPFPASSHVFRDPAALARAEALRLPWRPPASPAPWLRGQHLELPRWSRWLATNAPFAPATLSGGAAGDLLRLLGRFQPELEELRAASQRPAARWPLRYEDGWFVELADDKRTECVRRITHVLELRAVAGLAAGHTEAALTDITLMLRLADSFKDEPMFHSHLLANELLLTALQPVWEGLAARRWSEAQLAALQARLETFQPLARRPTALRGETYLFMEMCRQIDDVFSWRTLRTRGRELLHDAAIIPCGLMWLFYPSGWQYQDQVWLYRNYQRWATAADPAFVPSRPNWDRFPTDPLMAIFVVPRIIEMLHDLESFQRAQRAVAEASLACALERFHLAQRGYPDSLEALVPRYLEALPTAPGSTRPLLDYKRAANGRFLLFPAGMTGVSETYQQNEDRHLRHFHDLGDTDGVWRYPMKSP